MSLLRSMCGASKSRLRWLRARDLNLRPFRRSTCYDAVDGSHRRYRMSPLGTLPTFSDCRVKVRLPALNRHSSPNFGNAPIESRPEVRRAAAPARRQSSQRAKEPTSQGADEPRTEGSELSWPGLTAFVFFAFTVAGHLERTPEASL